MKRTIYFVLLAGSLIVGIGAMLWPAYDAAKSAFEGAGRSPGEYPGDHDCPAGQQAIEVVTRFSETFGGTNATGTLTTLYCEDAAGNRVNVSQQELQSEVSDTVDKVVIGIAVSIVAWIVFAGLMMIGAKSALSSVLRLPASRLRRRPSVYTGNVTGGDARLSGLDPRTAEQVGDILKGLGIDLSGMGVQAEPSDDPAAPGRTVAQRLQELNDLREAGLITREEYEEQRRAILQSLS